MAYEIRVEQTFCASHRLTLPGGALEPLHGHNWEVTVAVGSTELDEMDCVMDFHQLEKQLHAMLSHWHNRHLNDVAPFDGGVNPSAERVAEHIGRSLLLPEGVKLIRVDVVEAPRCRASFLP